MLYQLIAYALITIYDYYNGASTPLLYLGITIDGLFSAFSFIKASGQNLSNSQAVSSIKSIYKSSLMERYILYVSIYLFYTVVSYILWNTSIVIYYTLSLMFCPILTDTLIDTFYFKKLNTYINKSINIHIAKIVAYVINFVSEHSLNIKPEINYAELLPILETGNSYEYFKNFLKGFLISTLIYYIKSNGNHYYARMIKYFYNYKTGDYINKVDEEISKKKMKQIIMTRNWAELTRPDTTQTFFYLYKNGNKNIFKNIVTALNYEILKISAIWSVSSFFGMPCIITILSLFFSKNYNYPKLLSAASVLFIWNDQYLLQTLIAELGCYAIKQINMDQIDYDRLFNVIFIPSYIKFYLYFSDDIALLSIGLYYACVLSKDNKTYLLTIYYIIFGFISNYSITHLSCLTALGYILINIEIPKKRELKDIYICESYYNRRSCKMHYLSKVNLSNSVYFNLSHSYS